MDYITVDRDNPENVIGVRVSSDRMTGARIYPQDVLLIDMAAAVKDNDIIVCLLNKTTYIAKYLTVSGSPLLVFGNNNYSPIPITEKDNFFIFGKVFQIISYL